MRSSFKIVSKNLIWVSFLFIITSCTNAYTHQYSQAENKVFYEHECDYFGVIIQCEDINSSQQEDLHIYTLHSEFGELDYHVIGREVYYIEDLQMYFRTFYFISHGFSFLFPAEYTIDFNPGSWRGNYVWVLDAESILAVNLEEDEASIFMWLGNMRIHTPEFYINHTPESLMTYTELITKQGKVGYYIFFDNGFEFILDNLEDHFVFVADFSNEYLEFFKPILLHMAMSFRFF